MKSVKVGNYNFKTPMMQQYQRIKQQYPDCLLFFRMGDFYEMFLDDAYIGAEVLDITLTSRSKSKENRIPMAGVPYHAVDAYLSKLVKNGYKIAICEQVSQPNGRGIVDREVVRVVTPGTVLDSKNLERDQNNYLFSLSLGKNSVGICFADLSTGDFFADEFEFTKSANSLTNNLPTIKQILSDLLSIYHPSECIVEQKTYDNPEILKILKFKPDLNIYCYYKWDIFADNAKRIITDHFQVKTLHSFGLVDKSQGLKATAAMLGYLKYTQKDKIKHINSIKTIKNSDFINLDTSTITNLELIKTIREGNKKGSLLSQIDATTTAMGARLLYYWLLHPLAKKKDIEVRQNIVKIFKNNLKLTDQIKELLKKTSDIERLISKISAGIANAKDLIILKNSLKQILKLKEILEDYDSEILNQITSKIDFSVQQTFRDINKYIIEEPSTDLKSGNLIKKGISKELDNLNEIINRNKNEIIQLELAERKRTNINNLKIRFNKVFGYYIEISKSHLTKVPKEYFRKQTMVNAERFITEELKEKENIILTTQQKTFEIEYQIYTNLINKISDNFHVLQQSTKAVAVIDCLLGFAFLARSKQYICPNITENNHLKITSGRHPVVEELLDENQFVENDIFLDPQAQQLIILTGPNMAGKSVFIRQVAVITLLAHIGSFVPAKSADIGLVDHIFVRSGASDMITTGLSTFMVEMVETAYILRQATQRSLIIMDEIGRGTSTYDGISIAWSVAQYLVTKNNVMAKTLFATHYHELQDLEQTYPNKIKNYHMAVQQHNGEPIFLYKVLPGEASHSFGVAVAKLAGIPKEVIINAEKMLKKLEQSHQHHNKMIKNKQNNKSAIELDNSLIHTKLVGIKELDQDLVNIIKKLDLLNLTPIQALNFLVKLKERI